MTRERPDAPSRPALGPRPLAAPPRLLVAASAAVVVAAVAMALVGAWRTGVSWDEPYHVMRLRNFLDHGWYAVDWSVGAGGSGDAESNTLVYGPVTMLLLHGLTALLGLEGWGSVATTPTAYAVRHLGVVAIGLAGTAAAAATTRVLLGSWRWALVTAAALLALPMWTGHLMFNVKDVPVATGYTLVTLALVAAVPPGRGRAPGRVLALCAGTVLMVGTRPAMASAVLGGALVLLAGLVVLRRPVRAVLVELAVGLGAAAAVLVALYPGVYAEPLHLLSSAEQSTSFRSDDVSPLYVPFHLVAQFPLLLQAAAVVGLLHVGRRVVRRDPRALGPALVVAQAAALPVVGVLTGSDLYNGLRQLLFAAPAWAVLVTLGLAHALRWAGERGRPRLAGGLAVVALVLPVADQATLFPYQYSWWNAPVDATRVSLISDYWRVSVPELLPEIPTDGQVVCSPTRSTTSGAPAGTPPAEDVEQSDMLAGRFSIDTSADCRTDPLGPLASLWAADGLPLDDALPHGEFYAVVDRDHEVPANCTRLAAVERTRHLRTVAMTYVARCRLDPPSLSEPVAFTRAPGEAMSPLKWAYAPEGWVMRESPDALDATGASASLAFAVPPGCGDCTLVADVEAPADLTVAVNDEPTSAFQSRGTLTVRLAPGTTDAWVTFTRTSGAPLGLRLTAVRVVPTGTSEGVR